MFNGLIRGRSLLQLKRTAVLAAFGLFALNVEAVIQIDKPLTNNGEFTLYLGEAGENVRLEERYELEDEWQNIYYGPSTSKIFRKNYTGKYYYRAQACRPATPDIGEVCYTWDSITVTVVRNNKPTTAVVLGDSFASGEGGRWRGNNLSNNASYGRTDGAWDASFSKDRDLDRVYEPESYENGCHRSYTAPIHHLTNKPLSGAAEGHSNTERENYPTLKNQVDITVNLACSGARNKHLWPVADGGEGTKQEVPQITRLKWLARSNDIKLIVLGAGGNDMGFGGLVQNCAIGWATAMGYSSLTNDIVTERMCFDAIDEAMGRLGEVKTKTQKSIDLIRRTMTEEGKTYGTDYRIVLTSYPSVIPRGHDFKYNELNRGNDVLANPFVQGQCPFTNGTAEKINTELMPAMSNTFRSVASDAGVDFIDVVGAFNGNRLCEQGTHRDFEVSGVRDYQETYGEFMRFLDVDILDYDKMFDYGTKFVTLYYLWKPSQFWRDTKQTFNIAQGHISESMHPNQLGQKAIGWCLRQWWDSKNPLMEGEYSCVREGYDVVEDATQVTTVSLSKLNARTLVAID